MEGEWNSSSYFVVKISVKVTSAIFDQGFYSRQGSKEMYSMHLEERSKFGRCQRPEL